MPISVPDSKLLIQRMLIQWGCIIIMGLLFSYFHFIQQHTRQRGFFCDDEALKHPYIDEETVPMTMALGIWVFAILATVIPTEALVDKTRPDQHDQSHTVKLCGVYIPFLVLELYRVFGYLLVGGSFCMLFTDISKNTIGRLRPHFLTLCKPWDNEFNGNCTEEKYNGVENMTYFRYTGDGQEDQVICGSFSLTDSENEALAKSLKEARLSFMSGHSSFSFFCAVFLIIYLQIRVPRIKFANSSSTLSKTLSQLMLYTRLFWQFGLGILAFWISMTRIADYFHHPGDVVTGSLVGIISASLTLYISGLSTKEYVFFVPEGSEDPNKCRATTPEKRQSEKTVEVEL